MKSSLSSSLSSLLLESSFVPVVLCAGFGNRLKPLTDLIPKVVCPIGDKPLAFYWIERFFKLGFSEVHVNTHYKDSLVREELEKARVNFGYNNHKITFWHEEDILETGGGLQRIYLELSKNSSSFQKDFIVISGDIFGESCLETLIQTWNSEKSKNSWALMLTRSLSENRNDVTWVDTEINEVIGFGKDITQETDNIKKVLFSNYQIISHEAFKDLPIEKKSSIDLYYRNGIFLKKSILNKLFEKTWFNMGEISTYLQVTETYGLEKKSSFFLLEKTENGAFNFSKTKHISLKFHKTQNLFLEIIELKKQYAPPLNQTAIPLNESFHPEKKLFLQWGEGNILYPFSSDIYFIF